MMPTPASFFVRLEVVILFWYFGDSTDSKYAFELFFPPEVFRKEERTWYV